MAVNRQHGSALVSVLWLSVVLALIAATMAGQQRQRIQAVQQQYDQLKAHYALLASEQWLLHQLLNHNANQPAPAIPERWAFAGYQFRPHIQPEDQLLNLNRAQAPALLTLLEGLAITTPPPHQLVDQILDWRDSDDLVRAQGAEQQHYQATPKQPGNRPFIHLDELHQVRDITPRLAAQLKPWLSLHSRAATPGPALLTQLAVQPATAQPAHTPAASHTWRLDIEGWHGSHFIGGLNSVQRKRAIATESPFQTLSWQLHAQPPVPHRRTNDASTPDAE